MIMTKRFAVGARPSARALPALKVSRQNYGGRAIGYLASKAWTSAQSCLHDSCSAADKWATAVASRRPANAWFGLPAPEPFLKPLALLWIAHRQQLAVRFQVGPQPVKSLLSPADPFLVIQLTCVVPPAAAGQGRCARGLVAMAVFEVVGRYRVGDQHLGEEAGGGDIALLFVTEMGILVPLVGIRRLRFTPEDGGQPAIEFDPPPAFSHPLSRRIAPILASRAQFVPTLQGDESLGILPLSPKRDGRGYSDSRHDRASGRWPGEGGASASSSRPMLISEVPRL